ncbi:hypothetical protein SteCoe_22848 [Stentor coeruleus]|uniref:Uncharacterized protein n=1 Tax=Stentor coeruleus TaxID=5963 RepID=A0A1R2BLF9_9CILI|nr:hypothetical protein SteCoe_22848 [Stentor coeruleus]
MLGYSTDMFFKTFFGAKNRDKKLMVFMMFIMVKFRFADDKAEESNDDDANKDLIDTGNTNKCKPKSRKSMIEELTRRPRLVDELYLNAKDIPAYLNFKPNFENIDKIYALMLTNQCRFPNDIPFEETEYGKRRNDMDYKKDDI